MHLGPFFEVPDSDLVIARGLSQEIFAASGQIPKSPCVGLFGGSLLFDLFDDIGGLEFFLGQCSQLFVGLEKLQFTISNFESFALPAIELLEHPKSVIRGAQDHQQHGIRIDSVATRQVIFDKESQFECLGFDPQ